MPRVSRDHLAARRQQILDGARACFTRFGYEGATVRRLEQSTGLSRGAIFHHYRGKDALFLAVLENTYAGIRNAEKQLSLLDAPPAEGIRRLIRFTWDYYVAHPNSCRF